MFNVKDPDEPVLTVVIPAYNADKFIGETLESIVNQKTNFKFDVLISDDCSTDNTYEICKKYSEDFNFIKIIRQKKNLGMTKNQHFVITYSQSKYIAYIDSDDLFCNDVYLQKQFDFLEERQEVTVVFSNVEIFDNHSTNKIRFDKNNKPPVVFDLHYYFQNTIPICNSATVFRGFYNDAIPMFFVNYFQYDWLLHIHHGLNGKFGYNNFIGTSYRIHDNNATNIRFAEKKIKDAIKLVYSIKPFLPTEYHKYFKHPLYEMNSLALFYLRYKKFHKFIYWYFKWLKCSSWKDIKIRDEFWLFRQEFFKK